MQLELCPHRHLPILINCKPGSSSIRVQRWKRELKKGYITSINDVQIQTIDDIKAMIAQARSNDPC